ncbi:MAG: STAS domain-containing protein [Terriglobales bacterium]
MLTVITKNLSDAVILQCSGRLVRGEETALLCSAIQQHGRTVILDLQGVDAIDAAGIGVLISLQAAGIYLKLINPNAQVRELLRITKLDSIFEICESLPTNRGTNQGMEGDPANAEPIPCCAQELN